MLNGMGAAERLAVSIHTLRDHWGGSVTIMVRTEEEWNLAHRIALDVICSVEQFRCLDKRPMLAKTQIPELAPYEETLFLDADTVIVGSLDEMFGHPLTLTKFANWQSNKRLTAKWIREWQENIHRDDFLEMIDTQLNTPYPTVNTGVFAFRRDNATLAIWKTLAYLNPNIKVVDQTAMQILTSTIPHRMMDDRFNNSIKYGWETVDVRLIHFHGRRHFSEVGKALWTGAFLRAMAANIGGIRDWAGQYDRRVRRWLEKQ